MSFYNGWAEVYDLIYANIKPDISFYLEYAKKRGSPILEIACGTGRVLIPLAEAGYEVWGIDSSPAMLAKAKKKVSSLPENVKKRIRLIKADMRGFELDRQFPLILMPFSSFLLLLTVEDQIKSLKNMHACLRNDGVLIIDIFAPRYDYLANDKRQGLKKFFNPENQHVIIRNEYIIYDHANQLMDVDYTFEEHDALGNIVSRFKRFLKIRYIFRYEMEYLLKLSGFNLEKVYGTFDRKPYDYKSGEMIFIATK